MRNVFVTKGKSKGKFAVRADDGSLDDLDDISFDDLLKAMDDGDLDDLLAARGYTKKMPTMPAPGPVISRLAARLSAGYIVGGAGARIELLTREVAREMRLTEDHARDLVLQSPQGKDLWEEKRLEELEAGKELPAGWRGRSET